MKAQQLALLEDVAPREDPEYLTKQIITYIGNKRSLLPFVGHALEHVKKRLGKEKLNCLDVFSGTGIVSRYFKAHAHRLLSNDIELYSRIANECYLTNSSDIDWPALASHAAFLEEKIAHLWAPGFIADLYAPRDDACIQPDERVFYTKRNAVYLDTARQAISLLPRQMQIYFIAPLLAQASVHTNTAGVFKGFYKSRKGNVGQFGGEGRHALTRICRDMTIDIPILSRFSCESRVTQEDANQLVGSLASEEFDIAYIDPPYNQHPYGSNYFMLNILATYQCPTALSRVSGIPTQWTRSRYNQRGEAEHALFDVVARCPSKFVLLSYNSEGFVSYDRFLQTLNKMGRITTFETAYNTFRGSRNLSKRALHVTEFLYLLERSNI